MMKSKRGKPKQTIFGIRPKEEDFRIIELIRSQLRQRMNGIDIGDALVLRYALKRAAEADQLEKTA